MKREIGALALLGVLIAGSVWNIRKADRLTGEIREHIEISEQAVRAGDSKYAVEQLEAALRIWLAARDYTQIVLRHPELDAASDMFYELMQELQRRLDESEEELNAILEAIQNALGQIAAILASATDTQTEIASQMGQMA